MKRHRLGLTAGPGPAPALDTRLGTIRRRRHRRQVSRLARNTGWALGFLLLGGAAVGWLSQLVGGR